MNLCWWGWLRFFLASKFLANYCCRTLTQEFTWGRIGSVVSWADVYGGFGFVLSFQIPAQLLFPSSCSRFYLGEDGFRHFLSSRVFA
jgi:hypothetical protein